MQYENIQRLAIEIPWKFFHGITPSIMNNFFLILREMVRIISLHAVNVIVENPKRAKYGTLL